MEIYQPNLLSISQVNRLTREEFASIFANVIELCPEAALRVGDKRPFESTFQLCETFAHYLYSRTEHDQVAILSQHPDLAAALTRDKLTPESSREQAAAGLMDISDDERHLIDHYNANYKKKFGFPFIICARENKVKSIIDDLTRRYSNHRANEVATAIEEVIKICKLRIIDLVEL